MKLQTLMDWEEAHEKNRKNKRKAEALVAALQTCRVQDPPGTSTDCYLLPVLKPGHFKKNCPSHKKKPP
ncbi:hCG1818236 [Homo sapiens]|uniref:Putative transcript Y 10 protein n=1 Tax=Homo sapiens TaxID=9606 RepID=TTY10_HUMAN|nr:PUTATIVE PSEUDOGENE: RecName: Full=Putative transcript Y 10 protein [Homo sapiens]AAK13489.1 transcript Y 10 [Homo sapiens]EAX11717.1 hCG1818236 [Homo sapiens]